eukprot:11190627-Karenia_brevis.AAC.1
MYRLSQRYMWGPAENDLHASETLPPSWRMSGQLPNAVGTIIPETETDDVDDGDGEGDDGGDDEDDD